MQQNSKTIREKLQKKVGSYLVPFASRGYDSAGLAVDGPNATPLLVKRRGNVDQLQAAIDGVPMVHQSGSVCGE